MKLERFKDAVTICNGKDYKHIEADEGYPVMGSGGQFAYASDYIHDGEVILLGRKGTIDRPLYYNGKFWSVDTMYYAVPKNGYCAKFLYYVSVTFPYLKYSTATALPSMTKTTLERFFIPKLIFSEQEAIAAYLDKECELIGKKVDLLEQKADRYRRLRRAIINQAVTRGLNPEAELKYSGNSWIGIIPKHWNYKRVEHYFNNLTALNSEFKYKKAFKFYMGTIVPKNEDRDDEEYRETYEKYTIVQPGDIMINGLNLNYDFNSLRVGYVPADGIITSAYVVLRPNKGVKTRYYTYLLKAFDDRKFFHGMGRGVRLTLSYRELAKYEIPIPPLPEQDEIVSYLDDKCGKIDKIVSRIELEISKLKELKRSLINEVVTGQRPIK
jgi:type I restriction enzyme S subunit